MTEPKQLTDQLTVRPQVLPEELSRLASAGFMGVINNRPDDEEPGQPKSSQLQAEAHRLGLSYWHIPVVPGRATREDAEAFAWALRQSEGPVVAFCRTGGRAAALWEASQKGE